MLANIINRKTQSFLNDKNGYLIGMLDLYYLNNATDLLFLLLLDEASKKDLLDKTDFKIKHPDLVDIVGIWHNSSFQIICEYDESQECVEEINDAMNNFDEINQDMRSKIKPFNFWSAINFDFPSNRNTINNENVWQQLIQELKKQNVWWRGISMSHDIKLNNYLDKIFIINNTKHEYVDMNEYKNLPNIVNSNNDRLNPLFVLIISELFSKIVHQNQDWDDDNLSVSFYLPQNATKMSLTNFIANDDDEYL